MSSRRDQATKGQARRGIGAKCRRLAIFGQDDHHRLACLVMDADAVAGSPSTVHPVLKADNRLDRWNRTLSKKGDAFDPPLQLHKHRHIDMSNLKAAGTSYDLCWLLDNCVAHQRNTEANFSPPGEL